MSGGGGGTHEVVALQLGLSRLQWAVRRKQIQKGMFTCQILVHALNDVR
jgi:hypothetical protein